MEKKKKITNMDEFMISRILVLSNLSSAEMAETLALDYRISLENYLGPFGLLVKSFERYFPSNYPKSQGLYLNTIYSQIIHLFLWAFTGRCFALLILNSKYHVYLGHIPEHEFLLYLMTFISTYCSIICYLYYDGFKRSKRRMDWFEPFQVSLRDFVPVII